MCQEEQQMKHGLSFFTSVVVPFLMVTACASNPGQSISLEENLAQRGFAIGQPVKRINNYQINGWNSVDLKHVIINFGASRDYLVTLRTSCDGVLSAELLSFSTTVGFLSDKDKLLVRNAGHHLSHCYIDTIHELEKIKKTDMDQ
jgi:hypothetical protein